MKLIILIVICLFINVSVYSQTKCDTAAQKAKFEHSSDIWTGIGAGFPLISIGAAILYKPSPKDTAIVNNTEALKCYETQAKQEQINSALRGSIYGLVAITIFSLLF